MGIARLLHYYMAKYFIIIALLCPLLDFGQCIYGTVSSDLDGKPLENASVFIPEQAQLIETDSTGYFKLCGLQKGKTVVQVTALGHKPLIKVVYLSEADEAVEFRMESTTIIYPEITVFANDIRQQDETPTQVQSISLSEMNAEGAISLSDGLAKLSGVGQLTTGPGISKPVIRGLFGNRIQTVQFGLRFDNQQWQDEHGMGLSTMGIDHVEVIKGAASLLYGSEAMGGVIQLIEEKPAQIGTIAADFSTQFFTNTYGTANQIGLKGSKKGLNWRVRAKMESHADYTDGNGKRILNSRFDGYHAKASVGFKRKNWLSQTNYLFSLSNFGFLMDSTTEILTADARQSRTFQLPHHTVYLNILASQQTFYLKKSTLKWTLGAQINNRQEQEGGNKISLDMLLNTYSSDLLWAKDLNKSVSLSLGTHQDVQTNRNNGSRAIVPDANTFENACFAYLKGKGKIFSYEGGLRYSLKRIETFNTGNINSGLDNPGKDVLPFERWYQSLTGSAGISWINQKHWQAKTNISSGFRPGNLAELSSNGLHEGSIRYEIGSIDLKTEQNACVDLFIGYTTAHFTFSTAGYINRFFNYIYLNPTDKEYIGFQIFEFIQEDAMLKGNESSLEIHPENWPWFNLKSTYSVVIGKTDVGNNLPFIPAAQWNQALRFKLKHLSGLQEPFLQLKMDYSFQQDYPGQFETPTNAYTLYGASLGFSVKMGKRLLTCAVSGQNLLNNTYFAHLSRYKYFNIYNSGRTIAIYLKLEI